MKPIGHIVRVKTNIQNFIADEDGVATIEMVVMMAASIGLSLAVMDVVSNGIENLSNDISTFLSDYEIRTSFDDEAENS